MKKIGLLLCIVAVGLMVWAGTFMQESQPSQTVEHFMQACGRQDISEMMDCMDPELVEGIKGATGFIGGIVGQIVGFNYDNDLAWAALPFLQDIMPQGERVLKDLIYDEQLDGSNAVVTATVADNGKSARFYLRKIKNDWKIYNIEK